MLRPLPTEKPKTAPVTLWVLAFPVVAIAAFGLLMIGNQLHLEFSIRRAMLAVVGAFAGSGILMLLEKLMQRFARGDVATQEREERQAYLHMRLAAEKDAIATETARRDREQKEIAAVENRMREFYARRHTSVN